MRTSKDTTLIGLRMVIDDPTHNDIINTCITQSYKYLNGEITESDIIPKRYDIVMLLSDICKDYIKNMDINNISNLDYRNLYDIIFYI